MPGVFKIKNLQDAEFTLTHPDGAGAISIASNNIAKIDAVNAALAGKANTIVANDSQIKTALNATGTAPIYACRAWVNFNGTGTVAIRASGNVSSITDNGVGNYTVNFTTAMPDENYAGVGSIQGAGIGIIPVIGVNQGNNQTINSVNIYTTTTYNGSPTDFNYIAISIFR